MTISAAKNHQFSVVCLSVCLFIGSSCNRSPYRDPKPPYHTAPHPHMFKLVHLALTIQNSSNSPGRVGKQKAGALPSPERPSCYEWNYSLQAKTSVQLPLWLIYIAGDGLRFSFQTQWLHCSLQNMFTWRRLGLGSLVTTSVQDRDPSQYPYPSPSRAM